MDTVVRGERFTLYRGDCLALVPGLDPVECVVTSPPYNLNKAASGGGKSRQSYAGWYPDEKEERRYQAEQRLLIASLLERCRGSIFYNHRVRYAWHSRNRFRLPANIYHPMHWLADFPIWQEIIWDRRGTTGHANGRCRLADERIYQIGKPHVFHDRGYRTVWDFPPDGNEGHVCAFTEEVVRRCLSMATDPGDTVLDPYAGSGTAGVVALGMGRRFVGIELDPDYFALARERLEAAERRSA